MVALTLPPRRTAELAAAALFAAATWFHFLVGGFWFVAFLGLRLAAPRRDLRSLALTAAAYAACVAPLVLLIVSTRGAVAMAAELPSPDVIYSLLRAPHHVAPFASFDGFFASWLPGLLVVAAMLATAVVVARTAPGERLRTAARWLAGLHVFLLGAAVLSFLDRDTGILGKFYLFRPSGLLLLLWLAMAVAYVNALGAARLRLVKGLALALIAPPLVLAGIRGVLYEAHFHAEYDPQKIELAAFLATQSPQDRVVLVDPAVEFKFLDLERKTGRPALVFWKFDPTNDRDLIEWFRRTERRRRVFEEGCAAAGEPHVDFLLTAPERAAALAARCGRLAFATADIALVRYRPRPQE